jgi:hypothetical protein
VHRPRWILPSFSKIAARTHITIQQMLLTHFGVTGRPTLLARADEVIE